MLLNSHQITQRRLPSRVGGTTREFQITLCQVSNDQLMTTWLQDHSQLGWVELTECKVSHHWKRSFKTGTKLRWRTWTRATRRLQNMKSTKISWPLLLFIKVSRWECNNSLWSLEPIHLSESELWLKTACLWIITLDLAAERWRLGTYLHLMLMWRTNSTRAWPRDRLKHQRFFTFLQPWLMQTSKERSLKLRLIWNKQEAGIY